MTTTGAGGVSGDERLNHREGKPAGGWLPGLLLIAATLLAYQPAWNAGFVWDDHSHVERNRAIFGPDGLKHIWFSRAAPQYYPLVFSSFWLERKLWSAHPAGYHLVNILLHSFNALLIWRLLVRLRVPGAWLAAAMFALHPVNVESAAWITERKNTLSMFFFLLTILFYLRAEGARGERFEDGRCSLANAPAPSAGLHPPPSLFYALSLGAFVLALLSKTAVAPLPAVLLLCLWWERGQTADAKSQKSEPRSRNTQYAAYLTLRDLLRVLPFAALALAFIPLTVLFEHQAGSEAIRHDPFLARLAGAGCAFWFYLYKALLPINLCFVYPRWEIKGTEVMAHLPSLLTAGAFLVFGFYSRSWARAWFFAFAYFAVMLLPELGFVNIYAMRFTSISDHWQYFAITGPIALTAAGIALALSRWAKRTPWVRALVYASILLALGRLTWSQSRIFSSDETLWQAAVAANANAWMAHNNLAICILNEPTRLEEARHHLEESLRLNPNQGQPHLNLGAIMMKVKNWDGAKDEFEKALAISPNSHVTENALGLLADEQGRFEEALAHLRRAVNLSPDYAEAYNSLGLTLRKQGRIEGAEAAFLEALRLDPELGNAHNGLGLLLLERGRPRQATAQFREALSLEPRNAEMHNNLGISLAAEGDLTGAQAEFEGALRLNPALGDAHLNAGNALLLQGRPAEAVPHCRQALATRPDSAKAYLVLARCLSALGKPDEAAQHFSEALRSNPDLAEAHFYWADLLLRQGKRDEAARHYEAALGIRPDYAEAHYQLGVIMADRKQEREAAHHFREALRLKPDWVEAMNNLAWMLGTDLNETVRNGAEAVRWAERACQLTKRQRPAMLDTLAAAYAEVGRFEEAVSTTEENRALALATHDAAAAQTAEKRLELYKAREAYRDK
jgi:tetratricopeptide (TPR) repeat protein